MKMVYTGKIISREKALNNPNINELGIYTHSDGERYRAFFHFLGKNVLLKRNSNAEGEYVCETINVCVTSELLEDIVPFYKTKIGWKYFKAINNDKIKDLQLKVFTFVVFSSVLLIMAGVIIKL